MRAPPENQTAPGTSRGGGVVSGKEKKTLANTPARRAQQEFIAAIDKSHSCQLRVSLSEWRGQYKIEIADFSAVIPGTYFQAGAGISLDVDKLPELIAALRRAEAESSLLQTSWRWLRQCLPLPASKSRWCGPKRAGLLSLCSCRSRLR